MKTNVASRPRIGQAVGIQFAALPYRETADGGLEVLLITTLRSKRWIIPKGWPIDGLEPPQSAAREALEEAGVSGDVEEVRLGYFSYLKELRKSISVPCRVDVFALRVTRQRRSWPERDVREQRWFPLHEAIAVVAEPGLQRLIGKLAARAAVRRV